MLSNDIHQLIISPSAHLVSLKDGSVKYLKRKSVIGIPETLRAGEKRPVYFIERDAYSGAMYAELRITHDLSQVADFLYNSWIEKDVKKYLPFGSPKALVISQTIADFIPNVLNNLSRFNIKVLYPEDGFSSGVRAVRTLEDALRFYFYKRSAAPALITQALDTFTLGSNGIPRGRTKSRFQVWYEGTTGMKINVPGKDREAFVKFLNGESLKL